MSNGDVRIGVYVCHCGVNIAKVVRIDELVEFARTLPGVVVVRDYQYMCSDTGQGLIVDDAAKEGVNRVVIAACSPRLHEETYKKAMTLAGLNPYLMEMANIREHDSWVHTDSDAATEKAKWLVRAAVMRAALLEELPQRYKDVVRSVLVVGGGIAGIQTALDVANAGYQVYLVEREPSIGGHMIQLDKTFPTLDCSACILTPKMFDCGRHEKIKLMTLSEVEEVKGSAGDYKVKVRRRARYVDEDKCVGCMACVQKCPTSVSSEYNYGLGKRKAIYLQFPQAVPKVPVLDADACRYMTDGKCGVCAKVCPVGAVNYEDTDEVVELNVGFIVVATGYDLIDLERLPQYGWGRYPNVIHSLQLERMFNASGPTGGDVKLADGRTPRSVAILHCVGSRDENYCEYCSRVCCMYALKFAHLLKERCGKDTQVYNFYIDMRCFGKGYEEFYKRVSEEGVHFVRGKVARVLSSGEAPEGMEIDEGQLVVEAEDTLGGRFLRVGVDMVVLCPAMVPPAGSGELAVTLKISRSADGFVLERHPKLDPVATLTEGIYVAGCAQGPKDVPDTVAQASGAAARIIPALRRGRIRREPLVAEVDPEFCNRCGLCVSVCPYGARVLEDGPAVVVESACVGCGSCAVACPSAATTMRNMTRDALLDSVRAGTLHAGARAW